MKRYYLYDSGLSVGCESNVIAVELMEESEADRRNKYHSENGSTAKWILLAEVFKLNKAKLIKQQSGI